MRNIFICVLLIMCMSIHAQKNLGGWEFLTWSQKTESIESKLQNEHIVYDLDTVGCYTLFHFKWEGYSTYLNVNANGLYEVTQSMSFSYHELSDSKDAFKALETNLVKRFGKYYQRMEESTEDWIRLVWLLKHTQITVIYDHKKKIVDEFGAGSYRIDITYSSL